MPKLLTRASSAQSPAIDATVRDHAGHDITRSFKIMVFQEPPPVPSKNLSTRNERTYSRPIDHCHGHGGETIFIRSVCKPEPGRPRSLQAYETFCHRIVEAYDPWTGSADGPFAANGTADVPSYRHGHCRDDEICVNGLGPVKSRSGHQLATCVGVEFFLTMVEYGRGNKSAPKTGLEGSKASMVVSKADGNTPLEVDTFAVDPLFVANDHLGADGEGVTADSDVVHGFQSKCRDCVELETQQFVKGTEGLRAQATLLTTGAAAGILWLTILSG